MVNVAKRHKSTRNVSLYSNLAQKRRTRKDSSSRAHAEYLASLPKDPIKRILYRMHPKNVMHYWFSRRGLIMALKISGISILLLFLLIGALFAYYRKDLDSINPSTLASRVKTTVTRYYDRNENLLWQDNGQTNYSIVVKGDQINDNVKKATIAIEDKDYYKHGAISVSGTFRAFLSNAQGNSVQGGSTLTQQLVKQVFFSDQAQDRGFGGVPRKIKEMILSVEVFRMYSRDDILNLYLNESSYGGPRNGVQSASKTYFNKDAKDLTLPEAALLAAIPNAPGVYDPYNTAGHDRLVARQHEVLDKMREQGYINQKQADEAKAFPILDHIQPQQNQYAGMKAPHFVQMVQQQLRKQLGANVVGQGGLNVYTTLDLNIQEKLQANISDIFSGKLTDRNCSYANCSEIAGFSNGAGAIEDPNTGQVLALVGSRDFDYPKFGQDNAATAFIQPGSSIKPLVFSQLFQNQGGNNQNYYSGTILPDTKTTFPGNYTPNDSDMQFKGNITIRNSLDWSRNIPAVKAMQVNDRNNAGSTLKTIQALGDKSYCTNGADQQVSWSLAIGGCGAKLIEHTNAFASLARMGSYIPQSYTVKVTNSQNQILSQYKNPESTQAIDKQAAYVVSDILGDKAARAGLGWNQDYLTRLGAMGVKTAVKTGTSNAEDARGKAIAKDIWTAGYTPHLAMAVWLGNPDTTPLKSGNSLIPAMVFDKTMAEATQYLIDTGKAQASDWFTAPAGIQKVGNEIAPSYYNKSQASSESNRSFDKVSKKLATNCTPDGAKVDMPVKKTVDAYTNKEILSAGDGFDPNAQDDAHKCSDAKPSVGSIYAKKEGDKYSVSVSVAAGTNPLQSVSFKIDGQDAGTQNVSGSGTYSTNFMPTKSGAITVEVTATDTVFYTATSSGSFTAQGPS